MRTQSLGLNIHQITHEDSMEGEGDRDHKNILIDWTGEGGRKRRGGGGLFGNNLAYSITGETAARQRTGAKLQIKALRCIRVTHADFGGNRRDCSI